MSPNPCVDDIDIDPAVTCSSCKACCCRLEVMLMGDDEPPPQYTVEDRWGGWVMRRLDDGWCAALDRHSMLCTIYQRRPFICRDYQAGDSDCLDQRRQLLPPGAANAAGQSAHHE